MKYESNKKVAVTLVQFNNRKECIYYVTSN